MFFSRRIGLQSQRCLAHRHARRALVLLLAVCPCLAPCLAPSPAAAQAPADVAAGRAAPNISPQLRGRTIEEVRILGNQQVRTAIISNMVRSRPGDAFDPGTVEEDYHRVYSLNKFANVEARVEPTDTGGVIVVFVVTERKQINSVRFRGNQKLETFALLHAIDLAAGQAIDEFRISVAKTMIEGMYRERNYPFARVELLREPLQQTGDVIFEIVEGPNVRVRNVEFKGNRSFSDDRLSSQVKTKPWIFVFRQGRLDYQQLEEDVAAVRKFYEGKGFFDVRVGRTISFSPDQTEAQVNFVVEEGARYTIERVTFEGNTSVGEADFRKRMKLLEGRAYDADLLQRDVREVVRAYSPFGFIYQPQSTDRDYLRIDTKTVYLTAPSKVEVVYSIREGKPFHIGRVLVKGNYKSQDKLVLREMRVSPGDLYNSAELLDATERLRRSPYFDGIVMSPIGNDENARDVLVEVSEAHTASFNVGAGINSNGGVAGNITYEQRNFDLGNPPDDIRDLFSESSFTGGGQTLRITFEPGTEQTNASIRFFEPWLFDQPYSFSAEAYLRDRQREHYDDQRIGTRLAFGKRFDYIWSGLISLRGEDIDIDHIEHRPLRAEEILNAEGHSTLTSVGLQIKRDTTNPGFFPYKGTTATAAWESYGALGGDYSFQKFTLGWDGYIALGEDLLDRKTVLGLHANGGYITGDSVFFERFYGGGIGSVRGFQYRGISPRSGPDDDPVGGDFLATGTVELNFPLAGETLRGVVFSDVGTVEEEFGLGTIRASVGAGFRLVLPFLGQAPLAIDFAIPIAEGDKDDRQLISFSFGFTP